MSELEKKIAANLVKAVMVLPESKKEYILGFAEGVAAMTETREVESCSVEMGEGIQAVMDQQN